MSKQATSIKNAEIILDQNATAPLYKQLYERLRAKILAGQLEAGARLPSTRVLASELGVSRNTTALAYELLLLEGFIESRVGDGTRVAHLQAEQLLQPPRRAATQETAPPLPVALSKRTQSLVRLSYPDELDVGQSRPETNLFGVGLPDVSYFPYETWAKLVARHARQSLQDASLYQNPQGYAPLREAIATHIGIRRGVHCSPDQVILTSGAQGAFDLVARVLLNPGDPVWVEDPGYLGARGPLVAVGARLVAVPVDEEGIDVAAGIQLGRDARMAIITPSHQFPTGVTMSLNRRLALLEWSREARSWLIEDDYDSEFRFSGRPLEALQSFDNAGRVIYIGTFSKVLFPSLRLGYLVAPPELLTGFLAARRFVDVHLPLLEQMALTDFITEGHFARHLRKMRLLYLERRNTLINALSQELGDVLDITVPEAGIHLTAWLSSYTSARVAVQRAAARGLRIQRVSQFSLRSHPRDGLLLGFACDTPQELRAGVKTLAQALRG